GGYRNGERSVKKVRRSGKRVDVTQTRYEAEYQTIKKLQKEGYKVIHLCDALGVSRAGYYKWLKRKPTASEKRLRKLTELILQVYENHKCVYCLMKLLNLKAVIRRKRYRYKPHNPAHIADNVLNREFRKDYQSMEVLLTDVTEFKYGENAKAYLSAILDYGENKIVAF